MARKRRYEVFLVIEANSSEAGRTAANAAWYAANGTTGCAVVTEIAQERLPDGNPSATTWPDWQEEGAPSLRIAYPDDMEKSD